MPYQFVEQLLKIRWKTYAKFLWKFLSYYLTEERLGNTKTMHEKLYCPATITR